LAILSRLIAGFGVGPSSLVCLSIPSSQFPNNREHYNAMLQLGEISGLLLGVLYCVAFLPIISFEVILLISAIQLLIIIIVLIVYIPDRFNDLEIEVK